MQMEAETNSPEDASAMAFGLHQVTHQTRAENVLPAETLIEVQNQENTTNLERETTEINSTNDSEEQEKVPVLHTGEELENDDGGKFKQEKAKDEATKMQLLETATDSPLEDKVQSTTPTFEIVKGDTEEILQSPQKNDEVAVIDKSSTKDNNLEDDVQFDIEEAKVIEEATRTKLLNTATEILPVEEVQPRLPTPTIVQHIIQQQPLHQDESEANDNAMNCTAESKFDRISTVAEEPGEAETKESIGIVKEEQADHQSEVQVSSESSTKLSDHVNINEKKTVESCSAENLNNNEAIEITVEEATNAKHPTDVEIPKSATEDEAMQTKTNKESVKTEEVNESSQEERQPEAEIAEKFNKEGQTPQYDTKCPKINTTNHEEQKVVASHSMDKLGIEDDGKLDQEEAKGIEASHSMDKLGIEDDGKLDQEEAKGIEATKTKLPEEEVLTTLPTPAFVQIDTNQILQQLSPHNDESDVINKAKKSSFPEIERNGMSTVVEELVKPENAENIGIEKQEQADHLAEKSCKHETIESHSVENLEDIDATEITAEETDAKESIDVEIPKSEAEGVSKDNTLQTIPNTKSVGNEIVEESSQEESQAEAESSVKFNKEVQTTQCDTKETTKINTTNNTEQHEVPVSHAREKLGIDDDGTFDEEEARGTEEAAKMQLPEEEVLTTLPTPAFVQVDTDKNLQQQSLHNDELEAINIAQKGCLPEIKPDGMSTILEELERPENQDNMRKEKEEQKDHQVDKSNEQNDNTNYMIAEGHNTSESSTKLSGDFDSEEHKIIELHSVENLEDLDVTKIVAEIETAKQSTDVEIPKSETEDDNTLQSIANTELVRNKSVEQSSQEEREQEAESSAKFNKAVQTIEYDIEETANTTNDTEQREEFPACAKEKLGIVGKFNQEARGIEEVTKNQLPRKEVQATLPTPAIVQGDNDQILQKQTLHNDEPQAIDNTKKSNLELEPDGMSMVVEELEKPEIQENVNIDKEEQANLQVEESSEQTDIINYVTAEVPAFHAKEKLGIKDDEKFNEEAREIEEATKMQLADEEIQTTLLPPTFVQVDRDCILQQITLHIDELEAIDNAKKNSIPEIEPDGMSTVVQELEKPENPDISIEKEEQAGHKVAESSMQTQNIDYIEAEGCITRESSTKLSDDIDISGHKKVESHSAENLEEMDTKEITAEEATDVKQSTDVEKPKSETEGFSGNEDVDENNKKGRQLAAVVTEKFKPQCDTKETDETNTTNYIEKQEQVQAPHTHDKLEIKDDGKIDQEEDKGILEETITQLQEEAVQTTLPTPAIFQGDTDKISQQQTLHDDESEANDNDKSCILEIQLEGKSIIVEESEKSENKDNIGIEKEEQAEGYSVQNAITNYIIAEGPVTSQSSTKLSDDVDFDEQKTIESRSIQNLENMDASETTAEESPDAKILTDVEMPTKETKGAPEDKALQTIPNKGSVRNELVNESTQEVRRPEAEFTEKFNKELQTPPHDTEETTKINTTNDIMEQEEVQATYTKEKLEIEDHGKFYPKEEARVIEETEKTKLSDIELQTTLSIPTLVRCDTDHISQQQTLHDDESDTIDNANKSCIPEIELQEKSTVIEELEKPENDVCIEKEAAYQVEELDMQNDITNYITAKGPVTSEISTKLNDVDVDQQKTIESHSIENLENMDASEITAEEATNAKQSIDVEITKSEIEDKALKTMPNVASVRNGAVDEGRHKETQPEGEFTEKTNREVQTGPPQEVLRASHAKEKLGVEEDKKFDQEIKTQLTEQKVQTLHNDELEGIIDNAKLGKPEIELDGKSTFVEDHEKPETMENDSKVKEEQAYCQSEESSMSTVIINYVTTEGCFTSESSTKLSDDIKVNEQKIVDSQLVENLETKNASEITADEATDAIQSTDMEIPKSETEVLSEDKALQSIPNTWSVENELVDESTQEERQPEAEFKEKINKEMHTPKYYTKETGKIITTNETQEQEVRASHVKEKLGIEDDGKFNQEVEGTEEEKKMQLPGQEVQTTLPTNKILQQQTLHNDETKVIDNAKSCIPEIELDQKSTVVEEIEQPETKENDSIVKEEQAYHISGEASVPTVITNSVTVEGHNSSESSRKSSDDVDVNQTKTADLHSVENLEKKNPSDITAEEAANAIQSTDLEIPELETQGMPDEKALQSIPNTWLAENKAIDESGQDERQPEAEFTEEQGPKHDTQQIMGIITANDTKEQEQDPKEKLGAEDNGKFNQEEAKGIEGKKYQLTDEELQTTLQTSACVGHTDLISQQVTLQHKDELEGIMSEIELHGKSNVEEPEPIEEKSKAEFIEKINKVESPKYNMEETAQIIITNDTEEQKEVLESDPKEKLVIAVSGKFNQEETKAQLPDEEVPTTLSTPASVLGHIDQISQQQTLHNHESEGIDNAKSYITDIELHGKFTVVEEPETKQNDNMEREEQTYLQSEESSMPTFTANMVTAEGYLASERSTKLSDDAKLDQQEIVESYSVENLEKKNEGDITSQDATDATQSAEVEISKSETEGEPESKALQSILNTRPVKNETLADSSEEQRQPEAEFKEKINKEVQSPTDDMEETAEIITTNDTKEQKEVLASNPKEKQGIEVDEKFNLEESHGNEEETKAQLPDEEVQTTLSTPASTLSHTDRISQKQTQHKDESESIDNAKSCIAEIELHGKSSVVEKPENKQNDTIEREEQTYLQSEEPSIPTFTTNIVTAEGHLASESSTKLSDDPEVDQQESIESYSVKYLDNKTESDVNSEEAREAIQLGDVEISMSKTEGVPEDKALESILNTRSAKNETLAERSEEERQPEAEFIEKINKVQSPTYDMEETEEIITANDTEEQKEVQASDLKEKLGIEVYGKFNQEEAERNEEETKAHLTDEEVQTTLSTPASTLGHSDRISHQESQHNDESEGIDNAKSCMPEIELHGKSTVVEEPENKQKDNIEREEQTYIQSEESRMSTFTTNIVTAEGNLASESSTNLSDDAEVNQQETVESYSVKNLENKTESDINSKEATEAIQSVDVEISKSETEGVPEDKALQLILNTRSVKKETFTKSSEERQPEAEFIEKINKEVQSPICDMEENAEIITANDTEEQKEVSAFDPKEKLGNEYGAKFNQEEAKGNGEETKAQLPDEEVQTTFSTPASILGPTDQISQQQTLHNDELEMIDNAKSCIPDIEHHGKFTDVEEPEKQNENIEKEKQTYLQSEESSMPTFTANIVTAEEHPASESSIKLSDDTEVNQQQSVESYLVVNLEKKNESDITSEEATDAIQLADVEISKSETEGVPEDKTLQSILNTRSVKNETLADSSEGERQPEPEFIEKINKEVQTAKYDLEEIAEIITPNDTEERKEVPASDPKENLGIEVYGKFNQEEAKGNEEQTKAQLPDEEVQTTLSTPASLLGHTDKISQQQTLYSDESERIDNAKNYIPEIELHGKSTVAEEPEEPETKEIHSIKKEEQAYLQSEESSEPTLTTSYVTAEGHLASESSTKLSDNIKVDGQETVGSYLVENLEKNESDITSVEATNAIKSADMEMSKSKTKGLIEDEIWEILSTPEIVQVDTEQIIQQTLYKDESEATDDVQSCIAKTELDRMITVVEEPDQPKTKVNVVIVEEEQADNQSQGSSIQSVITNCIVPEGRRASESSTKISYDMNEQKTVEDLEIKDASKITEEDLEIKDASKITAEEVTNDKELSNVEIEKSETEGVPEDNVLQTLANAALVRNETVDESHKKEIQSVEEFEETYTKVQTPQYEFNAKEDILEKETCQLTAKDEQKSESQSVLHNEETKDMKHPYSDGETAEINHTHDTEEQEDFSVSPTKEKLVVEDDEKFNQEEAKRIDEATKTQLLNTARESLKEEEVQPKFATPATVQGDLDQILHKQTLHNDESEAIDNSRSCIPENEPERMSIVFEDLNQPEMMANFSIVKEEQRDHQSEPSSRQSANSNYINAVLQISESSAKLCDDVDQQKTVDSHSDSVNNLESVPVDKAMQTLPSTISAGIEEVDKSIQEIHTEAKLALTDTGEGPISEKESEAKKEVSEYVLENTFDLYKATSQTIVENGQKAELLSEQQSQETTVTDHLNLEGETIKINPTNEIEEHEKVKASHNRETLETDNDGNFIQEEEKEMEKATERQLLKTATESVPKDQVQSTVVKGETVEGIVQEQTIEEKESAAIDNNTGRPENELEQMVNVVEAIDQHETMAKISVVNEEHASHHCEQSNMETVISKHVNSEGMVTVENNTKSSYNVEELKKVLDSNTIENSEIKNGRKIMLEEASNMKEATGMELKRPEIENVHEDEAISTVPTIPSSVKVEIVDKSIQKATHKEVEPEVTNTIEEQRAENDFAKNMEVLKASELHKAPGNTSLEDIKKAEVQSEAKRQDIMITKHPYLESQETEEISPSNYTKELEKEHQVTKPRGVSESVYADITEQTETEKPETQEVETTQLDNTKEDEFEKISPSSSFSVISRDSQDTDTKVSQKKSHGILSGVGSKVKHSISKVKKAITGKSSHPKTSPSSK